MAINKNQTAKPNINEQESYFHLINIQEADCIYIEVGDSDELESIEGEELDEIGGNTADMRNNDIAIKRVLNIDKKKRIRVATKTNKHTLIERRRKTDARLEDLATRCDPSLFPKTLRMKSDLYYWIMLLSGVFYVLPAMQLMFGLQEIFKQTGNQDICYYNFLCRRTSEYFEDYGHIFSNLAYIFCGMYFILLVAIRRHRRRNAMLELYCQTKKCTKIVTKEQMRKEKKKLAGKNFEFLNQCGIPEQYGIFYAMGGGLILEGMLSACYHVCPVEESFQFDTTFMYIITVLIFLKMYQFRHPDITSNAYNMFSFIAIMLIFEAFGYYSSPGFFMFFFISTYLILIYALIVQFYFQKKFLRIVRFMFISQIEISGSFMRNLNFFSFMFSWRRQFVGIISIGF